MPRYHTALFDADNTLFDFDRAEEAALTATLAAFGLPDTPAVRARYLELNRTLWARLDRGEVTREWLVVERFAALLRELDRPGDPARVNRFYLERLGEGAFLLPGAEELIRALAGRCTLAVITNGVALAQRGRFFRSPLASLIPHLFISEEVGASKPSPDFFRPVLAALGLTDLRGVLVVGDNLTADIGGGAAVGLDTAWYNPAHLPAGPVRPTWEVDRLEQLLPLILGPEDGPAYGN